MDIVEQIKQTAVNHFLGVLNSSADHNAPFRSLVTTKVGDSIKPLLLIGTAHSKVEDGHCMAFLNPDESLVNELTAGCGYGRMHLKEIVAKRCDLMLDVWIDAYREDGVTITSQYKARNAQPAKFAVT